MEMKCIELDELIFFFFLFFFFGETVILSLFLISLWWGKNVGRDVLDYMEGYLT